MRSKRDDTSRRAFLSGAAAVSASFWIPKTVKGYSPAEARVAIFAFIEGWYNTRRRHSALDYQSPIAFEQTQRPAAEVGA